MQGLSAEEAVVARHASPQTGILTVLGRPSSFMPTIRWKRRAYSFDSTADMPFMSFGAQRRPSTILSSLGGRTPRNGRRFPASEGAPEPLEASPMAQRVL